MYNIAHMTQYNFDILPNRRNSDSLKWHLYDPDVLPMWVADMDFRSPEPVIQALRERAEHGIFGYPLGLQGNPKELPELCQAVIDRLDKLYHWAVKTDEIVLSPGVVIGFNLACHALANAQEGVLVQTPVYLPILTAAKNTGILRQEMELTHLPGGDYSIDWEAFEASITDQTRLFILCNPHNPVGRVFQKEELERMAEICLRHGVTIVSDEIHCDLIYAGYRHIPIASLDPEIAKNTITLMAPSKTFNIAGLDFSLAIIQNPELRKRYLEASKGLISGMNLMGIVAARAAYLHGQEWLDQLVKYLQANRDYLYQYVKQELPGIEMGLPEGTYLAWLDCRNAGISDNPFKFFLEKGRVAFNDGATFGSGGEGFIRLNFGCPHSMLTQTLERMKLALLLQH